MVEATDPEIKELTNGKVPSSKNFIKMNRKKIHKLITFTKKRDEDFENKT